MVYKLDVSYATKNKDGRKNQDNLMIDRFVVCCSELSQFCGRVETDTYEKMLFLVSDGAGGSFDGGRASDITVHTVSKHLDFIKCSDTQSALLKTMDAANADVTGFYENTGQVGAATVSGVLFDREQVWVFNAGDSPVYYIEGRKIKRLNCEHTVAARKNSDDYLNKDTVDANTITNYMGNPDKTGSAQTYLCNLPAKADVTFVIASDGVEKGLSDKQLSRLVAKKSNNIAEEIVKKAYQCGANDDITAVVIRVSL